MGITRIDDQDASVSYTGSWRKGGMEKEYKSTVTSSTNAGDGFTVTFTGTKIDVYATIDSLSNGVITSYSIDGQTAVQDTTGKVDGDTYNQLIWSSPNLAPGKHTLDVKMVHVNPQPDGEGTIWFDYFDVTPAAATAADSSSSSSSGSSVASTPPPPTSTAGKATKTLSSNTGIPTPSPDASSNGKTSGGNNHTGAIVGAVIAVLLIILALTAGFLFWRQRKRKANAGSSDSFEKFFNNPPQTQTPDQTPLTQQVPSSAYPFAAGGAATAVQANAPYNPYAASTISSAPSSFSPNAMLGSGVGVRRPSLDQTSVTSSSNPMAPSQRYLYAVNSENVLSYGAPGVAYSSKAAEAAAEAAANAAASPSSSSTAPQLTLSFPGSSLGGTSTPLPPPGTYDPDSVSELKKRQQEAIANYNAGIAQGTSQHVTNLSVDNGPQFVQHVDSGLRGPGAATVELPPAYTPA